MISGHRDPRMLSRYTRLQPEVVALKLRGPSAPQSRNARKAGRYPRPSGNCLWTLNGRHCSECRLSAVTHLPIILKFKGNTGDLI